MAADVAECMLLSPEILLELKDKINISVAPSPRMAFAAQIFNFFINCPNFTTKTIRFVL